MYHFILCGDKRPSNETPIKQNALEMRRLITPTLFQPVLKNSLLKPTLVKSSTRDLLNVSKWSTFIDFPRSTTHLAIQVQLIERVNSQLTGSVTITLLNPRKLWESGAATLSVDIINATGQHMVGMVVGNPKPQMWFNHGISRTQNGSWNVQSQSQKKNSIQKDGNCIKRTTITNYNILGVLQRVRN